MGRIAAHAPFWRKTVPRNRTTGRVTTRSRSSPQRDLVSLIGEVRGFDRGDEQTVALDRIRS
ncbi:MAG TPA: hypothetical protein VFQ53_40240 [Kofleriaceae bacterium]|nr:hypothetical protein [Kofleriaceae bacterium]